jgi:hypothetical protein
MPNLGQMLARKAELIVKRAADWTPDDAYVPTTAVVR